MQSKFFWYWSNIMSSILGARPATVKFVLAQMPQVNPWVQIFGHKYYRVAWVATLLCCKAFISLRAMSARGPGGSSERKISNSAAASVGRF
jgi:hypothetical protein